VLNALFFYLKHLDLRLVTIQLDELYFYLKCLGLVTIRPVTSLEHQGGAKSFLRGAHIFTLCPIDLNYVQNIFPGGAIIFLGEFTPLRPPGYNPSNPKVIFAACMLLRVCVDLDQDAAKAFFKGKEEYDQMIAQSCHGVVKRIECFQ